MNIFRSVFLILVVLLFSMPLSASTLYPWASHPQIAWEDNAQGETILTITFDFSEMANPPSSFHYPTRFQIQTSPNGVDWTELDPVSISPRPTTTLFDMTYNLGKVSETLQTRARLQCSIHDWSIWSEEVFTITPGGDQGGGDPQAEKTLTKTVTTTSTHTTTTTDIRSTTTTVTQTSTNLLTTTQRETLTETTTSTFTGEIPMIESSSLALLGAGIAVAGIAIALSLTRRK